MIQSVQRAAAILRSFTEAEPELRVTELSQRLGLHKSTVSRILSTLQHEGFVSQNPESGRYRLGVGLVSLAGVALGRLNVRGVSQPHLNALVELSEETVNVTILDGSESVIVLRAASPKPIQYLGWIGRRTPLHCTASGKVLLAHMTPQKRDLILAAPLPRFTDKTITVRGPLLSSLANVCDQGYSIVHEEFEEGFSAIAAPIFNHLSEEVATVSISGPTFRIGPGKIEAFIEPLLQTSRTISVELGYKAPF
jgi:DNA-binding IclR family transcriptional regulator